MDFIAVTSNLAREIEAITGRNDVIKTEIQPYGKMVYLDYDTAHFTLNTNGLNNLAVMNKLYSNDVIREILR